MLDYSFSLKCFNIKSKFLCRVAKGSLLFLRLMEEQIPDSETTENKKTVPVGVQEYAVVEGTWKNR